MSSARTALPQHIDVLVVGAGLSGVDAAYRLQTESPDRSYLIVEARDDLGGTWDLFRYPGVRSDSDMFTLGYPFKPWKDAKSIADGEAILRYIRETADDFGISEKIRYGYRVTSADWSNTEQQWTVDLQRGTEHVSMTCGFLYVCAGYYDYGSGHAPRFPGQESFDGLLVHPQFWPEDLDHDGKRVVVIGSGATAVTLVPAMASARTSVTMLQRSPTWISAVPSRDKHADRLRAHLPEALAHRLARTKNVLFNIGFHQYCERFPERARELLQRQTVRILGPEATAEHFTPSYRPWEQRLCAAPGADIFKAIKAGHARVVTDTVDTFVPEGIRLRSGEVLEADIVVSATGLKLTTFGGIRLEVDGAPVDLAEQYVWKGAMVTGLPNFAFTIGYTQLSWTLRADLTARLVCKVLNSMRRRGQRAVVPVPDEGLEPLPLFNLTSGYVQRSVDAFPRQAGRSPWRMHQNHLVDLVTTLRRNDTRALRPLPALDSDPVTA